VNEVRIIPVVGMPEVRSGDDVASLIAEVHEGGLEQHDVVVVTQKVVSKAEDRVVSADNRAAVAAAESVRMLRRRGSTIISETRHGFVCANAGVDDSNVEEGLMTLLPVDPDLSARRIRARLAHLSGVDVAVIISDTFGRAWRTGQTDVAIGVAGLEPIVDYRGRPDAFGRTLEATMIAVADEIAGAAEMVMGKSFGIPAAVVRGAPVTFGRGSGQELVRHPLEDLFR
jgi:coenzyme F420-0:L-glutamate ligase / coenzyme F420-1:gamma-L-glutamate ligase